MSALTVVFLVCLVLTVLVTATFYRTGDEEWYEALAACAGISAFALVVCTIVFAGVQSASDGTFEGRYDSNLIPIVEQGDSYLGISPKNDTRYMFVYENEDGSPVKSTAWPGDVTLVDTDSEPYVTVETYAGPTWAFPWEWMQWHEEKYVLHVDTEDVPIIED